MSTNLFTNLWIASLNKSSAVIELKRSLSAASTIAFRIFSNGYIQIGCDMQGNYTTGSRVWLAWHIEITYCNITLLRTFTNWDMGASIFIDDFTFETFYQLMTMFHRGVRHKEFVPLCAHSKCYFLICANWRSLGAKVLRNMARKSTDNALEIWKHIFLYSTVGVNIN